MKKKEISNLSSKENINIEDEKNISLLKKSIEPFEKLSKMFQDFEFISEFSEKIENCEKDLENLYENIECYMKNLKITCCLNEKYDHLPAILTVQSGSGGIDASDWTQMLFRMYTKWSEKKKFNMEVLEMLKCEEGGIKKGTMKINGEYAFGYLKNENGIHRLIRISPFDKQKRRHTSFASVNVLPMLEETKDIIINDDQLKIETFRAGGAGGQHVNTTDSAVRITDIKTGISISCQDERSQIKNLKKAKNLLKSKLQLLQIEEKKKELENINGKKLSISWGNQRRTYILDPQEMVKDNITGQINRNFQKIIDGEIDIFIEASLEQKLFQNN